LVTVTEKWANIACSGDVVPRVARRTPTQTLVVEQVAHYCRIGEKTFSAVSGTKIATAA